MSDGFPGGKYEKLVDAEDYVGSARTSPFSKKLAGYHALNVGRNKRHGTVRNDEGGRALRWGCVRVRFGGSGPS
ncbi:uncharacterized protein BT62DRAFT_936710 [Guyanagaster necrorhizus]|uniref:Uncharacterized protein n=1 Tax=Guyanagaster necrorhizus TaxID=856835 RepID=A0A9P8AN15_9AGAR|nr:uncharacterized protein BT62DRAFT_936710 [Guyanagaster necrorhizus MCA 3950]KAG7441828.1 hypothetical protein BT62DRAFT_936710 [Guyanagaster necrorhizus MCA 3950]